MSPIATQGSAVVTAHAAKHHSARPSKPKVPRQTTAANISTELPAHGSADMISENPSTSQIIKNLESPAMDELPAYDDVVEDGLGTDSRRGSAAASSTVSASRPAMAVSPRQEEGSETLPDYSCTLTARAVFHRKMEYEGALHRARDRTWYKVLVELQGTALRIHKIRNTGVMAIINKISPSTEDLTRTEMAMCTVTPSADLPAWCGKGDLVKSYTLQHGDVGVAADYQKRRYVIRLRVETDQFLLSCLTLPTFVYWLELLSAAIILSPPLESRCLPKEYRIPRTRRRRGNNGSNDSNNNIHQDRNEARNDMRAMLRDEDVIMQQREILRVQFPSLSDEPPSPRLVFLRNRALSNATTATSSSSNASRANLSRSATAASTSSSSSSSSLSSQQEDLHPCVSAETGKWSPEHAWNRQVDLLYAKRSMAVLRKKSPRKSDVVIVHGEEWLVDWAKGYLWKVGLPQYGDEKKLQREARTLTRGCVIVRA